MELALLELRIFPLLFVVMFEALISFVFFVSKDLFWLWLLLTPVLTLWLLRFKNGLLGRLASPL